MSSSYYADTNVLNSTVNKGDFAIYSTDFAMGDLISRLGQNLLGMKVDLKNSSVLDVCLLLMTKIIFSSLFCLFLTCFSLREYL